MKPSTILAYALCAAADVFLMRVELRSDDTGVIAFLILLATFLLGSLHPRHAWQWALLVGLSLPAADLLFGARMSWGDAAKVAAFVVAIGLVGAYAGVLLRKMFDAAMPAAHR